MRRRLFDQLAAAALLAVLLTAFVIEAATSGLP